MSETKQPVRYAMQRRPMADDSTIYEAEIVDSRPYQRTETSEDRRRRVRDAFNGIAFGQPFEDEIPKTYSGFGRSEQVDYPTQPGFDFPKGGGSAPGTPYEGNGGNNGQWEEPAAGSNGWEAKMPGLTVHITQDYRANVVIGIRVSPGTLRRLALYIAFVLLLIAIGLYNLPDIGLGNILDIVFAFR